MIRGGLHRLDKLIFWVDACSAPQKAVPIFWTGSTTPPLSDNAKCREKAWPCCEIRSGTAAVNELLWEPSQQERANNNPTSILVLRPSTCYSSCCKERKITSTAPSPSSSQARKKMKSILRRPRHKFKRKPHRKSSSLSAGRAHTACTETCWCILSETIAARAQPRICLQNQKENDRGSYCQLEGLSSVPRCYLSQCWSRQCDCSERWLEAASQAAMHRAKLFQVSKRNSSTTLPDAGGSSPATFAQTEAAL